MNTNTAGGEPPPSTCGPGAVEPGRPGGGLARVLAAAYLMVAPIAAGGCAGSPWFLGRTRDGVPVIPASSHAETVGKHRIKLNAARRAGEKVVEIAELIALEERGALHAPERTRFAELLRERARDWAILGRPVPLADDLRHLIRIDPSRARGVAPSLRAATRAAGDFWLAIGENSRAEAEYRQAERMGADRMVYRLRAAWNASPGDLEATTLERALTDLPARALAPFTVAYLASGGQQPRALRRAWLVARVYGPPALCARLESMPSAAEFTTAVTPTPAPAPTPAPTSTPAPTPTPTPTPTAAPTATTPGTPASGDVAAASAEMPPPDSAQKFYGGATLARRLLPAILAFPALTAPGDRSREWADRLVAEDPTSPDSLEVAALIDARAGRVDGAARKLGDLVFYSADRATGYARAARVWERAGQGRRGCLAWKRATHFGALDDPRWCDLLACARREPVAADPAAVEVYIRARAPGLSCVTEMVVASPGSSRDAGPAAPPDVDAGVSDAAGGGDGLADADPAGADARRPASSAEHERDADGGSASVVD